MSLRTRIIRLNLTDRARRYRAQRPRFRPELPKQCGFCGSKKNVGVHHITGEESDEQPKDLMWACKSCNARIAVVMKNAGIGKRVRQFNPRGKSRPSGSAAVRRRNAGTKRELNEYAAAIKVMRGEFEGDVGKAVQTIRSTSPSVRSAYTRRTWPTRRAIYGPSGRQSEIPF